MEHALVPPTAVGPRGGGSGVAGVAKGNVTAPGGGLGGARLSIWRMASSGTWTPTLPDFGYPVGVFRNSKPAGGSSDCVLRMELSLPRSNTLGNSPVTMSTGLGMP